ncbi:MAG: signal transduction histidine kinase, partial [Porticoccaceae bacterium]
MRRLGISLLVVVVISIIGAGWIIDRLFSRLKAPDNTIAAAQVIGSQLAAQLDHSAQELVSLAATSATVGFDLTLIDRDDIAIPESLQPVLNSSAPLILESEKGISLYFLLPNTHRVLSVDLPRVVETRLRLILTLLFYTAVVFLLLLWLYPLVRRLHRLATAAKQFGEGELYQRISTHSRSQLYDIESEFNRMAQRIQDLVGDNKLLSSAVSHDLRTPLARLRFGVDA